MESSGINYYWYAVHHKTDEHGIRQSLLYSKTMTINTLSLEDEQQLEWNKELRANILWGVERVGTYAIKIREPKMKFDAISGKHPEIYKRLQYVYDGIIVEINHTRGTIRTINNIAEIQRKWERRKKNILKDYTGESVENYIQHLSQDISQENHYRDIFSQYQHFGLFFLNIRMSNDKEQVITRQVNIHNQETADISLIEEVRYDKKENGMEQYIIEGKVKSEDIALPHYEGKIYHNLKDTCINEVNLCMKYMKGRIKNEWEFTLCRIDATPPPSNDVEENTPPDKQANNSNFSFVVD